VGVLDEQAAVSRSAPTSARMRSFMEGLRAGGDEGADDVISATKEQRNKRVVIQRSIRTIGFGPEGA
jgi:hypothetical protein